MGTDENGRDVLARFLAGGRLSLLVGSTAACAAAVVGGALGIVAGTAGALLSGLIGRLMDAVLAFPSLLLAIAITVGLGPGVWTAALAIFVTAVPWFALLVRSDTLRIRHRAYIEAARALGSPRPRTVVRHVLPHVMPTVWVQLAVVFGYAILTFAGLGFMGLGAQPPTPEWGSMITEGLQYALTGPWWIGFFPGLGVFAAVAAANVLSDHVAVQVDPNAREG
jgi:peptide/nickel transport system permease protein